MIERPSFQTHCPQGRRDPYLAGLVPALDRRQPAWLWNQKVYKKDLEGTAGWLFSTGSPGAHTAQGGPLWGTALLWLHRKEEKPKHHRYSRSQPAGRAWWTEVQEEPWAPGAQTMDAVPLLSPLRT